MRRLHLLTAAIFAGAVAACSGPAEKNEGGSPGPAVAEVADPCGGPDGQVERSNAWLHAEMIRLGHDRALVCRTPGERLPMPAAGGGIEDLKAEIEQGDRIAAALEDEARLTGIMIERQTEAIAAAR